MAKASGWESSLTVDLVPLFESIQDLDGARAEMQKLYTHPVYAAHLDLRGGDQTVMLGFSDGTKDGGYLRANWAIYRAKQRLTDVSREHGRTVMFFDGRGGPPARGGGNTHRFYASLGRDIENREIQTTIQGQTISSNFGIPKSAGFNLELLFTAGVKNRLFDEEETRILPEDEALLDELGTTSYDHYLALRNRPEFTDYLATFGTLKYYGETNIGSRPTSRAKDGAINFEDLRAIPFVGSWSQLKQNVPGYFGLGTALEALDREGRLGRSREPLPPQRVLPHPRRELDAVHDQVRLPLDGAPCGASAVRRPVEHGARRVRAHPRPRFGHHRPAKTHGNGAVHSGEHPPSRQHHHAAARHPAVCLDRDGAPNLVRLAGRFGLDA